MISFDTCLGSIAILYSMKEEEILKAMTSPMHVTVPPRLAAVVRMIALSEGNVREPDKIALAFITGPCLAAMEAGFGIVNKEQAEAWLLEEG